MWQGSSLLRARGKVEDMLVAARFESAVIYRPGFVKNKEVLAKGGREGKRGSS